MITLIVKRGATVTLENLPPRSIALDGYVQGPAIDAEKERYSFDHHGGCIRMVTSATCVQVLDALLMGFNPDGFTVYVNDVDEDTVLAVWLLQNPSMAHIPRVQHIVNLAGKIDAHGLAYPAKDPTGLFAIFNSYAMNPLTLSREGGANNTELEVLLEACVHNVDELFAGTLSFREPDTRTFEILHTGIGGWVLVSSNTKVHDLIYTAGYTKAILHSPLPDGSHNYTVMKKSDLVSGFPVGPSSQPGTILHHLSKTEDGWGGGSTIGGAPRHTDGSRSKLAPLKVFTLVEDFLVSIQ